MSNSQARHSCRGKRLEVADLEGMRHYPQVLLESGKRPDLVLVSSTTDAIILVELTVPWDDRLQYSNALKADKYADLSMDLEAKGYRTNLFHRGWSKGRSRQVDYCLQRLLQESQRKPSASGVNDP